MLKDLIISLMSPKKAAASSFSLFQVGCNKSKPIFVWILTFLNYLNEIFQTDSFLIKDFENNWQLEVFYCDDNCKKSIQNNGHDCKNVKSLYIYSKVCIYIACISHVHVISRVGSFW